MVKPASSTKLMLPIITIFPSDSLWQSLHQMAYTSFGISNVATETQLREQCIFLYKRIYSCLLRLGVFIIFTT